ncbi:MAG: nuclear transport factor 2 family protein [Chromatiaceae bacterium]|jgi:ketosteroid isomerase-like protein|nr:nuclear transport factor 2 family protein [Chromatiaceae bacterium]
MPETYANPQDAEDAFYDAIDERDSKRLREVWEDSPDIACLLPMQPLLHGKQVLEAWTPLFGGDFHLDIQVRHVRWLETGDLAIHYLEEQIAVPGRPPQPPVLATNIYRRGADGWRMILHQNSPSPPLPSPAPGMSPDRVPGPSG